MEKGVASLLAYQKAFKLGMEIFTVSKSFPREEKYSLTDQIRRASRAVCANLAEAYAKRVYKSHFISKLTDAMMENNESAVWLEFAYKCDYITEERFSIYLNLNKEISKLINYMIQNPEKFSQKL